MHRTNPQNKFQRLIWKYTEDKSKCFGSLNFSGWCIMNVSIFWTVLSTSVSEVMYSLISLLLIYLLCAFSRSTWIKNSVRLVNKMLGSTLRPFSSKHGNSSSLSFSEVEHFSYWNLSITGALITLGKFILKFYNLLSSYNY